MDFVEIGTSNFDTLIEKASNSEIGISVEPLKCYIDDLPDKSNVKKMNIAITANKVDDFIDIYYIPKKVILDNRLPTWFKGCNTIGKYHPLHIKHNVQHLVAIDRVQLVNISDFFINNKIHELKYLKIDTEGHDLVIMNGLYDYLKNKDTTFYPSRIQFETNEHSKKEDVTVTINLFIQLGYTLESRGYDTVLVYK